MEERFQLHRKYVHVENFRNFGHGLYISEQQFFVATTSQLVDETGTNVVREE